MGAAFFYTYMIDPSGGLPQFGELTEIEGKIGRVTTQRYGIRFVLKDDSRELNYSSKMNALGLVGEALTTAGEQRVIVYADLNEPRSPMFSDNVYYNVFQIRIADRIVRSYEDSAREWISNQRLMPYLGVFCVVCGLIILWGGITSRR